MFCKNVNYLIKNDEDSVIILDRLLYWIKRYFALPSVNDDRVIWTKEQLGNLTELPPTKKLIFGVRIHESNVIRFNYGKFGKWYNLKEKRTRLILF